MPRQRTNAKVNDILTETIVKAGAGDVWRKECNQVTGRGKKSSLLILFVGAWGENYYC